MSRDQSTLRKEPWVMESYCLWAFYAINTSCHGQESEFGFPLMPSLVVRFDPGNKVTHWRHPGGKEKKLVRNGGVSSNVNLDRKVHWSNGLRMGALRDRLQ